MPDDYEGSDYNQVKIKILPGRGTNYNLTVESTVSVAKPEVTDIDVNSARVLSCLDHIKAGTAGGDLFEAFGKDLFSWLFVGSIKTAYDNTLQRADSEHKRGVRLVLEIAPQASELYQLPWSLLFDSTNGWWLGEVTAPGPWRTPLSFSVPGQAPRKPLNPQPLRILVVGASPSRFAPIDVKADVEGIKNGIRASERKIELDLEILSSEQRSVTLVSLQEALESFRPHILHFVCHGPREEEKDKLPPGLYLQDDEGCPIFQDIGVILGKLQLSGDLVRQVVFNVCNSDRAAWKLAEQGIQAIGMGVLPVSGNAAKAFAGGLYGALASGIQIDEAVNRARAAIRGDQTAGRRDWILPALFLPQGRATFPAPPKARGERLPPPSPSPPPPPPRPKAEEIPVEISPPKLTLRVSSFPSGGNVVLNGVQRSDKVTPAELSVIPGEYKVRLKKKGALTLPRSRRVRVEGETVSVWFLFVSPLWLLLPLGIMLGQYIWVTWRPAPPGMVRIPGGSFRTGGEESPLLDLMREYAGDIDLSLILEARPGRGRIEQRIWLDRFEVTNAQYRRFLEAVRAKGAGGHRQTHPGEPAGKDHTPELWNDASFNSPQQPVVGVDWWDADAFCHWTGKRLPTGDEWERAARGSGDPDRLYPWGDKFSAGRANTAEGPEPRPVPGGQFESDRSPEGAYDLGGNVSEWTATKGEVEGQEGRMAAGGSWQRPGELYSLVFLRRAGTPGFRSGDLGLRCAREADPDEPAPPDMVAIPPGEFRKGGPDAVALDLARRLQLAPQSLTMVLGERPKTIELPELYLDRYEVANRDYERFLEHLRQGAGSGDKEEDRLAAAAARQDPQLNPPDYPVVGVDWHDAVAYCRWAGKRLPTADEWEAAERGQEGRSYPWGKAFEPERCNTAESSDGSGKTSAVGAHPECRTPEGVFDLVGNADEWTASRKESKDGRDVRVIKGGAWNESGEMRGLGYFRATAAPDYDGDDMGFRCVADPRRSWLQKLLDLLLPG